MRCPSRTSILLRVEAFDQQRLVRREAFRPVPFMLRPVNWIPQFRVEFYYSTILGTSDAENDGLEVRVRDGAGVTKRERFAVDGFDWVPYVYDLM